MSKNWLRGKEAKMDHLTPNLFQKNTDLLNLFRTEWPSFLHIKMDTARAIQTLFASQLRL